MHLGVLLAHLGRSADEITICAAARSADVLGYHSLWAVDPRLAPPGPGDVVGIDAIVALEAAAGCTQQVRLGLHLPLSRVIALGRAPGIHSWAADRLSVAIDLDRDLDLDVDAIPATIDTLWRPHGSLLISSATPGVMELAAPRVDGWFATRSSLDAIRSRWAAIAAASAAAGRDPDTLSLVVRADIALTERPLSRHRSTFCGSLDQVVDDLIEVDRMGAASVVLAFTGDHRLDDLLGGYAAIAEGLELRSPS